MPSFQSSISKKYVFVASQRTKSKCVFAKGSQSTEPERRCPSEEPRGSMWSVAATEAGHGASVQPCLQSQGHLLCATNFNPEEHVPKFTSLGKHVVSPAWDDRYE